MELPFEKTVCRYWTQKRYTPLRLEETQEMKLPDSMPDIGHVIASWGQVVLRGKDWRTNGLSVNGGVMGWILYAPADGSEPRRLETWIPFQMRMDAPEQGPDGVIRAECMLRSIDARNTSARKVLVRAGIGALVQVLAPEEADLYAPGELPPDIEVLNRTYPMFLTRETGETSFLMDEELELPAGMAPIRELIYYCIQPRILEQKVMGGRAVFRGTGDLHLLYFDDAGKMVSHDCSVPFAQYLDLDREYESDAMISNLPAVTSLELEPMESGGLRLKCGLVSQYIVNAVSVIKILEDAYSPCRSVEPEYEELVLPAWLDALVEEAELSQQIPDTDTVPLDAIFFPDLPEQTRQGSGAQIRVGGTFQTVSMTHDGTYTARNQRAEAQRELSAECDTVAFLRPKGHVKSRRDGAGWRVDTIVAMDLDAVCTKPIRMVKGLEAGACGNPDPERPSVIIRACREEETLWDIAKYCGSTVSAIQRLNKLESEPEENRLLLIPVI